MDLTTTTRQVGDIVIVDINGRIVLGEASAALRSLVADLLKDGHKKILFNLANVSYIDSSGLGQLAWTESEQFATRRRNGRTTLRLPLRPSGNFVFFDSSKVTKEVRPRGSVPSFARPLNMPPVIAGTTWSSNSI